MRGRIVLALALAFSCVLGSSGRISGFQERVLDGRELRSLREGLASERLQEVVETLGEIRTAPHSLHGGLLFEAVLRSVRAVALAQERLPELSVRVEELRAERESTRESTSPTKARRLQAALDEAERERASYEVSLGEQLVLEARMLDTLSQVSGRLVPSARRAMAEDLAGRLSGLRALEDRLVLLRTLARVEDPLVVAQLMDVAVDRRESTPGVVAALVALKEQGATQALPAARRLLDHEDGRVRAEACEILRLAHKRSSIAPLIDSLQTAEGRSRDDLGRALRSLTGQPFASEPKIWKQWWAEHSEDFEMPPAPSAEPSRIDVGEESGTSFYGIHTDSEAVLFVIDVSSSMAQPANRGGTGAAVRGRKIDVVRANLRGAVMGLEESARFNVLLTADRCTPVFPDMVEANAENKERAIAVVLATEPEGRTNFHSAFVEAFTEAVGRATRGRRQSDAPPAVDTLFFLTDGRATVGELTLPRLLLLDVAARNRTLGIRVHAVGVGESDETFLEALAEQNGGRFVRY